MGGIAHFARNPGRGVRGYTGCADVSSTLPREAPSVRGFSEA